MRTLQQILSVYIGENAHAFSTNCLNDLPRHVLESILPYLSAERLHEIHSLSKTIGIDFDKYWREHIIRRWRRKLLSTMNVFQDLEQDSHSFYLMQHFHDLLDIYTTTHDMSQRGKMLILPHGMFTCPLHKLYSRMSSGFSATQIADQSELIKYAGYIQTLRVTGVQCDWIHNYPDLLTNLLDVTDRIQIVPVTEKYYCGIMKLLSTLMVHGRLKTAIFSACKLSDPYLKDLMSVVSGNTEHLRLCTTSLNKSPCNQTNSASYASFLQDSNKTDQVTCIKCNSHVQEFTCDLDHNSYEKCTKDHVTDVKSADDHVTEMKCTDDHVTEMKSTDDHMTEMKCIDDHVTDKNCASVLLNEVNVSDQVTDMNCASNYVTEIKDASDHVTDNFHDNDKETDNGMTKINSLWMKPVTQTIEIVPPSSSSSLSSLLSLHKSYQCQQQMDSSADEDIDLYLSEDECTYEPVAWSTTDVSELSKVQDPNYLFDEALIPMDDNSSSDIEQTLKQKSNITCSGYDLINHVSEYHHACQNCQILQEKSRMKISSESFYNQKASKVTDWEEQGQKEETLFNQRKEKGVWGGLESFAIFGVTKRSDMSQALLNSLPTWNSLTKFGIFDLDIHSEITVDEIMKMISSHQLSHLVLDNLYLPKSFFTKLIFTLNKNYRKRDTKGPVIELLDIQSLSSVIVYADTLPEDITLMGIITLDLSMNTLDDGAFPGLLYLLRNDQALRDLRLKCCGLGKKNLSELLDTLSAKKIISLNLTGNFIQTERVETAMLNFMQRCISLRTLVLENTNPRTEFVGSSCFIETVVNHPSLTSLSVANNCLENAAVKVLKGACCTDYQIRLKSLDIGHNRIKGEILLEAADYLRTHYVKRVPALDYLNISGNQMTCTVKDRLCDIFNGIVKEIEAEVIELNQPFAEYIAQM